MARAPAAAGTTRGPAPLPAVIHAPAFVRLEKTEIASLLNKLRSPLALHVYMLLRCEMQFTTGQYLGGYARLMELLTPPIPERGRRRPAPTYKQVRNAVAELISVGLVERGDKNEEQGELRLFLQPLGATKQAASIPRKAPTKTATKPKSVSARPVH